MFRKHFKKSSIAFVAISILGMVGLSACHRHRGPGQFVLRYMDRMASHLDLDESQEQKYQSLRSRIEADIQAARQSRLALVQKMQNDFSTPNTDINQVAQDLKTHHKQHSQDMAKAPDYLVEFYGILNAEQKREFNEEVSGHLKRLQKHMQ